MPPKVSAADATRLTRLIFGRWVAQKVQPRGIKVGDVIEDFKDGNLLFELLEELAETKYTGKRNATPKMRPHQLDNCNNALQFAFGPCGVEMKIKPSAEDLVDGDERNVLGFLWAVMLKYIKIGDDDDEAPLNAKDALMMWVTNKTSGYEGVEVKNFTTSFHDGLALGAIIHKHRPKLLDYDKLNKATPEENFKAVLEAAGKYFGFENYLEPSDIPKLDEKCMVVFVADFYYGIAEQRKLDLAARRIGKLVKLTEENDRLRAEYNETADAFVKHVKSVEGNLEDRTIDNTMAGARARLDAFYAYKENDKGDIIDRQLACEGLFNQLSMRLVQHHRPEFKPAEGCALEDLVASVKHLEECEAERQVALHKELNRQIRLAQLEVQHKDRFAKLETWYTAKQAFLAKKEDIHSISEAVLQLRLLDAYDKEHAATVSTTVEEKLKPLGAELVSEKFERSTEVQEREAKVNAWVEELAGLAAAKRPVLDDDLAREQFREQVRLENLQHVDKFETIAAWAAEKEAYLAVREEITSIAEAQTAISLLGVYEKDKEAMTEANVAALKALGAIILGKEYKTEYSQWKFETPDEITGREGEVDATWGRLEEASAEKSLILADHLAREEFRERVRVMVLQFEKQHAAIAAWAAEKEAYLAVREEITSVAEAQTAISLLAVYEQDKDTMTAANVAGLKKLGADILAQKYETKYSSYVWEKPEEITGHMDGVDATWARLDEASALKSLILQDHLAREQFREKVRVMVLQHVDQHSTLTAFYTAKSEYLQAREPIDSVADAETLISLLRAYEGDVARTTEMQVAQHKAHGEDIKAQKYETEYSSYVYEKPEEIDGRHTDIDTKWGELETLRAAKDAWLQEKLALEKEKERLRIEFAHQAAELLTYCNDGSENAALEHFGFNLEEVEAYQSTITSSREAMESESGAKVASAQGVFDEAAAMGVTENRYTTTTVADLEAAVAELRAAYDERDAKFAAELERQRENDRLCQEFAGLVEPLSTWISENKTAISTSKDELEAQLANVEAKIATATEEADGAKLPEIRTLAQTLKEREVTDNKHTNIGVKDIEVAWAQWGSFLGRKKSMLADEIEHVKLRGVTPEQFAEIEDNFKQFDKDGSNTIDKRELRACLYSLGEEKKPAEVEAIMTEYGKDGAIPYDGFREFMIHVLGDSDTKELVLEGFKLINRGDDEGVIELMELVMAEHDLEYVVRTSPGPNSGEGRVNYQTWADDVFSR